MYISPVLILRIVQGIFALVGMATTAAVAQFFNTAGQEDDVDVPTAITYFITISVLTMLIILPYVTVVPRYFPKLANSYGILAAEATTCILWLAGFAGIADFMRKDSFCDPSEHSVCNSLKASVACGVLEFVVFGVTAWFAFSHIFMGGRFTATKEGPAANLKEMNTRSWSGAERV